MAWIEYNFFLSKILQFPIRTSGKPIKMMKLKLSVLYFIVFSMQYKPSHLFTLLILTYPFQISSSMQWQICFIINYIICYWCKYESFEKCFSSFSLRLKTVISQLEANNHLWECMFLWEDMSLVKQVLVLDMQSGNTSISRGMWSVTWTSPISV